MKMVCEQCGATGEPAAVWTAGQRMRLECAACGHLNLVAAYGGTASEGDGAALEAGTAVVGVAPESDAGSPQPPWLGGAAHSPSVLLEQCQKCGMRQAPSEACVRCGFVFANYQPGKMPWEVVEPGTEEARARADALWRAALEAGTPQAHDAFHEHCLAHDLDELAGRRYRFHVADWPEDEVAAQQLERMIELGRSRMVARLGGERDALRTQLALTRRRLLTAVFVVGVALVILFFSMYPNLL